MPKYLSKCASVTCSSDALLEVERTQESAQEGPCVDAYHTGAVVTTPITDFMRLQIRLEAFNLFNTPQYDELQYEQNTGNADFGRINRNTRAQSNFQRFIQLGFRLIF